MMYWSPGKSRVRISSPSSTNRVPRFRWAYFLALFVNGKALVIHYDGNTAFPAVAEWVDTVVMGHGVFRGGFFVDDVINGRGCGYRTDRHEPSYHDYSLGFRCCADPE